jgi:SPP1 gp7 family putative phage head morphogenesis protein
MPTSVDVTDDPAEFEEAVRAFRRRVPMPDWKWDALTEAERELAFKVSGVAQADLATEAWEAMERAIKDGTTLEDFKKQVGPQLEAAWGKEDPARLETIFRTNALGAYNAGRHEIISHPEVRKARPYLRFDGIDDDRQTEICAALDGTVRPADDPFWHTHSPPLHFNCRSILVPLSDEEAEEEGIDKEGPDVDADDGFGKPPTVGGDWEPDPSSYPGPIGAELEKKIEAAPEPEPPPPPPPEPEHPPAFPKVEPQPAPESLPSVRAHPHRWETQAKTDDEFMVRNEKLLTEAASAVHDLTGHGTPAVAYASYPIDARGMFDPATGQITINPDLVTHIRAAVARGEIVTREEQNAFKTVLHEQLHAGSNQDYRYQGPGVAMEEATTELLAQYYKGQYHRAVGLRSKLADDVAIYREQDGVPVLNRETSYSHYLQSFGQLVAYVDGVSAADPAFDRHVAGRALQIKRLKGQPGDDRRYGLFVRAILDKRGIKGDDANYEQITGGIGRLLQKFMRATRVDTKRIAYVDEWIGRIVNGENYP